jgi:fatty-acyl-CoA synthase
MTGMKPWVRALQLTTKAADRVLPDLIEQFATTYGDSLALIGDSIFSYRQLSHVVQNHARWAIKTGIAGQPVALLMHNCAEYVAIWLGLTRVGCRVALLNTNLRRDSLCHCIRAVDAKYLIGSPDLTWTLADAIEVLQPEVVEGVDLAAWPLPKPQDVALYIYTSGTTGLPKAAKITQRRIVEWSYWFAGLENATAQDRLFNCLPLYHSVGGIVAIGSMLVVGGSVVIRRRFSTSNFWQDVNLYGCTIMQYIGEICRYLVQSPPSDLDRQHSLRLAVGNGLQADIWSKFQKRFGVPQVLEYYAATEGVLSLYNCNGKPGAIGHIPKPLEPYFAIKLIRVDQETGEPIRTNGFCAVSDVDEPGEAITAMRDDRVFDGYNDAAATDRKILRDVFVPGDRWYRTGDLMRRDAAGYFFFVDRLGDTFRWKGENVSTTEVAAVIRQCPGILDGIVYGVTVPDNEGRAGMAAIATTDDFCFTTLAEHVNRYLPSYARPQFVRVCRALELTGTFKLTKTRFINESYLTATDPIWRYDQRRNSFEPLEEAGTC